MMEEGTNNQIGQLIEPEPIAFAFGAPGWYILLAIILLSFLVYLLIWWIQYRKNAYRHEAIQYLSDLANKDLSFHDFAFQLLKMIKRVAITTYGREKIGHLNAQEWMDYILSKNPKAAFSKDMTLLIQAGVYNKRLLQEINKGKLIEEALHLIKKKYV